MDEYEVGRTIVVAFKTFAQPEGESHPVVPSKRYLRLEIVRTFKPFTLSVVCEVKPVGPKADLDLQLLLGLSHAPKQDTDTFVLKLYDRHYDHNVRQDKDRGRQYTEARETAYRAYVAERGLDVIWHDDEEDYDPMQPDWDYEEGKFEALLEREYRETFELESEIYARITSGLLQGDHPAAPYYFGNVEYESPVGTVNGILLENIQPAISLRAYLEAVGPCYHLDEAVRIVIHRVGNSLNSLVKYGYMNTDNRVDDILLRLPMGELLV